MKRSFIFLCFSIVIGCVEKNQESKTDKKVPKIEKREKALTYIDVWNEIELSHTDDKYGEWGGDTDLIRIYSDGKKTYANYRRYLGSKNPPPPPKTKEKPKMWYEYKTLEKKIDSIELNENEKTFS